VSRSLDFSLPATGSVDLRRSLEEALCSRFGERRRITRFHRTASAYRTSFALEELSVGLEDGTNLQLIFKDVSRQALRENASRAKPLFLHDPLREIETYRAVLAPSGLSAPAWYGASVDPDLGQYWLFIEHVRGWTLFEVEAVIWPHAARWLAAMHSSFSSHAGLPGLAREAHLLWYDADFYRIWPQRALQIVRGRDPSVTDGGHRVLEWIVGRYDQVVDRLVNLPRTFIHGEFFASNVLVQTIGDVHRVCPIDWEMAAIGPGLIDVAALTSGDWAPEQQRELAMAYWNALPPSERQDLDEFLTALDYCHLHLAMQWLGWSPEWSPPPEHAHNWLGEAVRLAESLAL
jgi:aminoglycoside phosphotransferase (APT) family kinase protein